VEELLLKQTIEEVARRSSLGFYSHLFVVPKKNGQLRPVINLRALNEHLEVPSFRMETVASVSAAIQPGDWAISVDLTDGYFHIPIAPTFRKYLRFVVNGRVYQFTALPFGLAPAPLVFTKVLSPLAAYLHAQGILFHRFLDDLLIRAPDLTTLHGAAVTTLRTLLNLGFMINLPKSMLTPSQDFVYIGVRFHTAQGLMYPPEDRIEKILDHIRRLRQHDSAPASL